MQDVDTASRPAVVPATAENILDAARRLKTGALVAFPTETVYGLGADATDDRAVAAIFDAKARPRFNPLIVHVPNKAAAAREVAFDARAERLAASFWPGPLTLVLKRRAESRLSLLVSAGLDTVALRVPGHNVAHALLNAVGRPIAAPSANRAGEMSPTEAAHVAASLGERVALILDGGRCPVGVEFDGRRPVRSDAASAAPGRCHARGFGSGDRSARHARSHGRRTGALARPDRPPLRAGTAA